VTYHQKIANCSSVVVMDKISILGRFVALDDTEEIMTVEQFVAKESGNSKKEKEKEMRGEMKNTLHSLDEVSKTLEVEFTITRQEFENLSKY
jgi:hypothetical protein